MFPLKICILLIYFCNTDCAPEDHELTSNSEEDADQPNDLPGHDVRKICDLIRCKTVLSKFAEDINSVLVANPLKEKETVDNLMNLVKAEIGAEGHVDSIFPDKQSRRLPCQKAIAAISYPILTVYSSQGQSYINAVTNVHGSKYWTQDTGGINSLLEVLFS
ncbi:hypothetical protein RB195_024015 [Necator americanus]|uniref:Uncharacterized protein n=1 Tax=Necator americanus TaxID=51031 RepID=A0ABR1EMA9_NECAM